MQKVAAADCLLSNEMQQQLRPAPAPCARARPGLKLTHSPSV